MISHYSGHVSRSEVEIVVGGSVNRCQTAVENKNGKQNEPRLVLSNLCDLSDDKVSEGYMPGGPRLHLNTARRLKSQY